MTSSQKLDIVSFQGQFSGSKINLIFLKMGFLHEYQIRGTTFIINIFYFNHYQKTLFSKNVPNFGQLAITSVYKISKISLSMLIFMKKSH